MTRSNGATDERDKVYALLALAGDPVVETIKPNYSASIASVCTDFAEKCIEQGLGADLIYHAGIDDQGVGHTEHIPPSILPLTSAQDTLSHRSPLVHNLKSFGSVASSLIP